MSTKQRGYDPLQLFASGRFRSAAEILLYHAQKGFRAPEVRVLPTAPIVVPLYEALVRAGMPLVLHIEFRSLTPAERAQYADGLKEVLQRWPRTPVGLIHMAQLDPDEADALVQAHANVFFLTSHADSLSVASSRQPWTNMFDGERFKPAWKRLIERHPDRFVFALDNVWAEHWRSEYPGKVALWRSALRDLDEAKARQVACGNAVRLWRLDEAAAAGDT